MKVLKISFAIFAFLAASAVAWHFYPKANMDYASAQQVNTVEAYQHFLEKYPNDQRRQSILARIDEMSWDLAKESNSVNGVDTYLRSFPNGNFAKDASALKENLEIASLPEFEGSVNAVMEIGGGLGSNGEMYLDGPILELVTRSGKFQILRTDKTVYQGMKASSNGFTWNLYKQFRIRGSLTGPPKGPHLEDVKFIDARVIQQLEK